MTLLGTSGKTQEPIREGLFETVAPSMEQARLMGSRCRDCAEVLLGRQPRCASCGGKDLDEIPLGRQGKLWTYTVIRHRPPGDYKGPDPFVPFVLGLVEVPEGIRVLAPIRCGLETVKIGMALELEVYPLYSDGDANEVMAFRFRPAQEELK